jgi:acetyltransferase-like isoleucine patch superfamily enzyme
MIKKFLIYLFPWPIRRILLNKWFGYEISSSAYIGYSWIFPEKLVMKEKSFISHFNVAVHLDKIVLSEYSSIGRSNWITGFSSKIISKHFEHILNRKSELRIGAHSAITKNHHIDCTSPIEIGSYCTIAGYYSQLLTHSIDLAENRQHSAPIMIGDYTFIGTNSVILGGSILPSYSILAAKSLLNKSFLEEWTVYGGVPANFIKKINKDNKYFYRSTGFVY